MRRLGVLVAIVGLLLGGCTAAPAESPTPSFAPVEPAAVVAARKQAGIADCPKSSATVPARADGLPDLVLECLGGDSTVRLAGLRGKPMVINLWAQWCPPCREESPYLRQYQKAAKGKVLLLGLNYNDPRPELAVEFASLVGWTFPQLADSDTRLATAMTVPGLPTTLFVDADGKLVHTVPGKLQSYDELVQLTRDKLGVTV
ncbi:MAG: TlpA disulfide reductase family protein [Micropruina sp.]|uniref:TlpA family protein disulfide reductase n=1 Tax=Micropruina sp. TaxID=2737536 RepID=UPI0039E6C4EA